MGAIVTKKTVINEKRALLACAVCCKGKGGVKTGDAVSVVVTEDTIVKK